MRVNWFILVLTVMIFLLSSCLSYEFPEPLTVQDDRIVGVFYYEDLENSFKEEIYLYSDGYFWDYVNFTDTQELLSDIGSYYYDSEQSSISFFYPNETDESNFTAIINNNFQSIETENETFIRIRDIDIQKYSKDLIAKTFILEYLYDNEKVIIELELDDQGSFIETSKYLDTGEIYTDSGKYFLSEESGCIYFIYYNWPDGNFYGKYDIDTNIIYTVEGDFEALE